MAMTIHVDIVSADKPILSGQATFVVAPTAMGEIGITPRHTQLLATLKPGEVRVTDEQGNTSHYFVSGGVIEVQPHKITILADSALREEDAHAVELAAEEARLQALETKGAIAEGAEVDYFRLQNELIEGAERLRWIREIRGSRTNISQ
ncbi:MAG: F0F1 ATP synthase subunit epsilon [Halothiobacillaceae bacterium]